MARGRMISRTLSTSERFARLHDEAGKLAEFCQSLYPLLVAHADDWGCQQGDTFTIKHAVLPTSPRKLAEFEMALKHLHNVGLVTWWEAEGKRHLYIRGFAAHQSLKGHDKDGRKRPIPEPPDFVGNFDVSAHPRPSSPNVALRELKGTELKVTEGNRTEVDQNKPAPKPRRAALPVEIQNAAEEPSPDRDAPALRDSPVSAPVRSDDRRLRVEGADEVAPIEARLRIPEPSTDGLGPRRSGAGDAEVVRATAGATADADGTEAAAAARPSVAGTEAGGMGGSRSDAGRQVSGWSRIGAA